MTPRRILRRLAVVAARGCVDLARMGGSRHPRRTRGLLVVLALWSTSPLSAISLEELDGHPDLTPKSYASFFEDFEYRLFREVQPPDQFLLNRVGDCDDYAILADHLLPKHGYETRLIHVRLAGMVSHAVCYVTEERVYLDYNNRAVFFRLTKSKPSLRAIAQKVADSLNANWTSASEFVYTYVSDRKVITATVVRTADPADDPPPGKAPPPPSNLLVN
ncbi:transglutaminase-like domain-containing protein [Actomonas aquatica]|uniref:Transglutaminase-like domain-containing protein n=1 Tax=Actomonas aquatica TaxID=2866162 RepID=A0ABZ1C6D2_9BACT|nr:transglutaminase-like domain-containing protein [Opitutus sp. WL0086]WRQ87016.1 transglutaminase-like domain-containing protein [Opitutus sp. WL0086]